MSGAYHAIQFRSQKPHDVQGNQMRKRANSEQKASFGPIDTKRHRQSYTYTFASSLLLGIKMFDFTERSLLRLSLLATNQILTRKESYNTSPTILAASLYVPNNFSH